jgi:uncharacterized protein YbjQ (UPF0145 family)
MHTPKDILVVTTSLIEGRPIEKYFKPISAHIVIGTNLFSDFLGGMTDIFGGRSQTYQRKLTSLYNEAIQELQQRAYELGANSIVGLSVDMDEISGGGKSMFMITATGTAVWAENQKKEGVENSKKSSENVSVEELVTLLKKKVLIDKAEKGELYVLEDDDWNFIIENKVVELFPFLMDKWKEAIGLDTFNAFSTKMTHYINSLSEETKYQFVYEELVNEKDGRIIPALSTLINNLRLVDYDIILKYLKSDDFQIQKRILNALIYDKPFYNEKDANTIDKMCELIECSR